MPKIETVAKARKAPGRCQKCGDEILVGQPYKHWSFRYGGKRIRCTKPECAPRPSDLTSNDKLATLWAAGETFDDEVSEWDGVEVDDLKQMLDEYAEAVREVAEMYREVAQNIEDGFQHPTAQSEEAESNADELESFADDIESIRDDIYEFDVEIARADVMIELNLDEDNTLTADQEEDIDIELASKKDDWVEEQRSKAADAPSNCPL